MGINCANFCVFLLCIVFAVSSEITNDTSSGNCSQKETWTEKNSSVTLNDNIILNGTAGNCGQKEALVSRLEVAVEIIANVKVKFPTDDGNILPQHKNMHSPGNLSYSDLLRMDQRRSDDGNNTHPLGNLDCSDVLRTGHRRSGVYTISPRIKLTEKEAFDVYCDMETDGGGWTVIQRRGDFQNPVDYFFKDWKSYKEGFGDLEKEFWLGNDNIFALTNQEIYTARFDLVDVKGNTIYAHYDAFWIDGENSKYTLHISNYSGNAGDSMKDSNDVKFSTRDQDNDKKKEKNCAEYYKGAWWFNHCFYAHLNGENLKGKVENHEGKIWFYWKNDESLAETEIKIRRRNLRS